MPDKYDPKPRGKRILLLDFDGCIHSYKNGWQGVAIIPDPPVPGVFEWIETALIYFDIHVYSSRSSSPEGKYAMYEYIKKHAGPDLALNLTYTSEKSRAWITIDDRCVCFNGKWSDTRYDPEELLKFNPWYKDQ
jgi:hypothetical protein